MWGSGKALLKKESEWELVEEGREQCSESGNSMDKSRKRMRHSGLAGQWLRPVSTRLVSLGWGVVRAVGAVEREKQDPEHGMACRPSYHQVLVEGKCVRGRTPGARALCTDRK